MAEDEPPSPTGPRRPETLSAAEEVTVAVAALTSFQQVTQQADAKAGTLVAVHVGLTAVVATQIGRVSRAVASWPSSLPFWLATTAYVTAFAVSGYLLVQVIRPRTGWPGGPNRFALVDGGPGRAVPGSSAGSVNGAQLAAQAWETAETLARIAVVKNRYTVLAVGWVATMVIVAAAWLVVVGTAR
ncbi:hypothetical protein [Streptomyces sp. 8N706]|uniref:hypothetical protein n=1 Tax=Streptomyces sp. 8N706 TaxID=3457416 RepID=UPI003FD01C0F